MTIDRASPSNQPILLPEQVTDSFYKTTSSNRRVKTATNVEPQLPKTQPGETRENKSILTRKVTALTPAIKRDSIDSGYDTESLNSYASSNTSGNSDSHSEILTSSDSDLKLFSERHKHIPYADENTIDDDNLTPTDIKQQINKQSDSNTSLYTNLKNNLEKISNNLDNIGFNTVNNLPRAINVFSKENTKQFISSCDQLKLNETGKGIIDNVNELLKWSQTTPKVPAENLNNAEKQYSKLQAQYTELSHKQLDKPSSKNSKKLLSLEDKMDTFMKDTLVPTRKEFDKPVYTRIDSQPSYITFKRNIKTLRDALPKDIHANAPIESKIRTWLYNIILERSKG